MNLEDKQILELNELCAALVDGTITESKGARLAKLLEESEEARRFYVRALGLSASLHSYASEMQSEASERKAAAASLIPVTFAWWAGALAAVAAAIALVFWLGNHRAPQTVAANPGRTEEFVAQITASKECEWVNTGVAAKAGEHLRKGQRLELARGLAEITFDSGAQVVLEGPASFEVNSAWDGILRHGAIKVNVPEEAVGFRIADSAVEVVDLGTEFTMIADRSGATDVLVIKGAVEAAPQNSGDPQTILLREKQSRRFAVSGVSDVEESEQKFARYSAPILLERFAPATGCVHWSFDDSQGRQFKAESIGLPLTGYDVQLQAVSASTLPSTHVEGRRQGALHLNGRAYAKAAFPGFSDSSPRTIAFWVKVPPDAQLSDAYAMVAWRAVSQKLGSRPVHIGWNRNPAEGTVGVLRTDYGGGYALGAMPLRDGRWHHIAVVFVPGEGAATPVQVNQYVDGKLEGEGHPSPPGSRGDASQPKAEDAAIVNDSVWLGCRLGLSGPRKDRFRGELDELFIVTRALGPREIVQLMRENQLLPPAVAAVQKSD